MILISSPLVLLAALTWVFVQDVSAPFKRFDKNKDGKLTQDEFPADRKGLFERIDTDHDGFITAAEDQAFFKRQRDQPQTNNRAPQIAESLEAKLDLSYAATDNPRQSLDLLLPKKPATDKPLPVIAFIHGGGCRTGDKRGGLPVVARFAENGEYAVVSIGYRLSGEAKWPAQIHDCKAAIRWLKANAEKYHLDPDRIGVMGTSAGGHLVAMLAVSGQVKSLEGTLGEHGDQSSAVRCVVDQFGPVEMLTMNSFPSKIDHDAANSPESLLIGGPIQENKELAQNASPISYVTESSAPILIVHGDKDPLVPINQSEIFAKALQQSKVDATFIKVENGQHGGFRSSELDRRIRLFFDRHLRDQQVEVSDEVIQQGQSAE